MEIYHQTYYQKHRKKILLQTKEHYQKYRKDILLRKKEYYQKNRQAILSKGESIKHRIWSKKYYIKYKTEKKIYSLNYNKDNPQKTEEAQKKYRKSDKFHIAARNRQHKRRIKKSNGSGITNRQWNELLRTYNFRCAYCGIQTNMTIDHVIPISKGGEHSIGNIVPACAECNNHKRASLTWKPQIFNKVIGG